MFALKYSLKYFYFFCYIPKIINFSKSHLVSEIWKSSLDALSLLLTTFFYDLRFSWSISARRIHCPGELFSRRTKEKKYFQAFFLENIKKIRERANNGLRLL